MTVAPRATRVARARVDSLIAFGFPIIQSAIAAGVAWFVAHDLIGHRRAFFAPIAALIALGGASTHRMRRVAELTLGVAVGIGIGDLLVAVIGSGVWQLALVVLLAMSAATLLGGGPLFVSQAASSGVLVATLTGSHNGSRFVDALVGGAVGLGVLTAIPQSPLRLARRMGAPVFAELAAALEEIATAVERRDVADARAALAHARAVEPMVSQWSEALLHGHETVRLSPPFWRSRTPLAAFSTAATYLELAVRNVRVLARASIRAIELDPSLPEEVPASIRALADAVTAIEPTLDGDDQSRAIASVLGAVALGSRALERDRELTVAHVVGQIRATATDLLRTLGVEQAVAIQRVRAAAGEPEDTPAVPAPHA
jgi:uncharacterized membrane protein YgaE (UPF0421/DUF939 family)